MRAEGPGPWVSCFFSLPGLERVNGRLHAGCSCFPLAPKKQDGESSGRNKRTRALLRSLQTSARPHPCHLSGWKDQPQNAKQGRRSFRLSHPPLCVPSRGPIRHLVIFLTSRTGIQIAIFTPITPQSQENVMETWLTRVYSVTAGGQPARSAGKEP